MKVAVICLSILALALAGCCLWLLRRSNRAPQTPAAPPAAPPADSGGIAQGELLDAFPDPFFVVDSGGRITLANQAAAAVFGPLPPVGRSIIETLGDARLTAPYQACRDKGKPVAGQVLLPPEAAPGRSAKPSNGEGLWLVDAAPLPGSAAGRSRLLLRDLSAGHRLDQIRKDFVANASHELRTPITLVSGYLESFLDDPTMLDDRPAALRYLTIMRKHTERIARIIEDMLLLSRIEAGSGASLKIEDFPLHDCVQDIVERLEALIRQRNAQVRLELHDPAATLHGDRFYWTQVFFNLIENSLKQNPRPGLVVIVRSLPITDGLRLEVEDNGVGIPGADLPFIFNRFYRVEKHHSQNEIKGTGLGLSIVKRAVEAHGGRISCESSQGIRTVFRMDLPCG